MPDLTDQKILDLLLYSWCVSSHQLNPNVLLRNPRAAHQLVLLTRLKHPYGKVGARTQTGKPIRSNACSILRASWFEPNDPVRFGWHTHRWIPVLVPLVNARVADFHGLVRVTGRKKQQRVVPIELLIDWLFHDGYTCYLPSEKLTHPFSYRLIHSCVRAFIHADI